MSEKIIFWVIASISCMVMIKIINSLIWRRRKKILSDLAIQSMTEPLQPLKMPKDADKWMDVLSRKK